MKNKTETIKFNVRVRRCYSSQEVLEHWAKQDIKPNLDSCGIRKGNDAYSNNVFYSANKCYSYGTHYELGRIVNYNGHDIYLVNDHGYSVTTAKHIRWAWRAASEKPRLKVSTLGYDIDEKTIIFEAFKRLESEIYSSLFDHFSRRKFWGLEYCTWDKLDNSWGIKQQIKEFNLLCDILNEKKRKIKISDDFKNLYDSHVILSIEKRKDIEKRKQLIVNELNQNESEF